MNKTCEDSEFIAGEKCGGRKLAVRRSLMAGLKWSRWFCGYSRIWVTLSVSITLKNKSEKETTRFQRSKKSKKHKKLCCKRLLMRQ